MEGNQFKLKLVIFTSLTFWFVFISLFVLVKEVVAGCYPNASFCTSRPTYCRCWCDDWMCAGCVYQSCENGAFCNGCDEAGCPCEGGGCFTGETKIEAKSHDNEIQGGSETKQIKDLKLGDTVESFDPEIGEITGGTVSDIMKLTRGGYYELETESGEKVRVTAEHPFLAVKNQGSINQVSNFKERMVNILSQTLTYKVITSLQGKIGEILR